MFSYCFKWKKKKNTESRNPNVARTKNGRIILLSKCAVCDGKRSKYIKQQEAKGLLRTLGKKTPLSKVSIIKQFNIIKQVKTRYKMNEIVNKFSLAWVKFMPEMHLTQPGFTYKGWGPFTKIKERIQKFKETGDSTYIYQNDLDKACFNMTWLMEILKI